jgi:hypothetical protein
MRKLYIYIFIFLTVNNLNAQITLTQATSSPKIGDTFHYIYGNSINFNYSQSGANQTWDLSSASGTSGSFVYKSLANSSQPTIFPNANLVESSLDGSGETYYNSSSSELTMEGNYASGILEMIYTDKREYLHFPITYNDVFNDTFSGTLQNFISNQSFDRSGSTETKADGYGTLILPYTTINNVLRIRYTSQYQDNYMGFTIAMYNDTTYSWYNATNRNIVASVSVGYCNGSLYSSEVTYMEQGDLNVGINDSKTNTQDISFYPNPAKNYIIVENKSDKTVPLNIYDIKGKLVKTVDSKDLQKTVDISNLSVGIYFIKYTIGNDSYTKKMIVE